MKQQVMGNKVSLVLVIMDPLTYATFSSFLPFIWHIPELLRPRWISVKCAQFWGTDTLDLAYGVNVLFSVTFLYFIFVF